MFLDFSFSKKETTALLDRFNRIRYERMVDWTKEFINNDFLPYLKETQMNGQKVNDFNDHLYDTMEGYAVRNSSSVGGVIGGVKMSWLAALLNNPQPINAKDKLMTVPLIKNRYKSYRSFVAEADKRLQLRPMGVVNGRIEYLAGIGNRKYMRPYYLLKARVHPKRSAGYIDIAMAEKHDDYRRYIEDRIIQYFS